ncbi:MAG: AmmeMemoRadiSam system protein B [Chloroflexi bacterium]|nr:AmmeMemoRadiSam system protein B [Chloroflexota bacterium]
MNGKRHISLRTPKSPIAREVVITTVRQPAVAGTFYPARPDELRRMVEEFVGTAVVPPLPTAPKAIIAPHAGYIYSGPTAAAAYAALRQFASQVQRVVLLGPAHTLAFDGLAAPDADSFATPLGEVLLDWAALDSILALPSVQVLPAAHAREHGLEVHLPFLQVVVGGAFRLVPLVVGDVWAEEVTAVLDLLWGGPETLIVISSDLSHYHDYATAQRMDAATAEAIEQLNPAAIGRDQACGRRPIQGLLLAAQMRHLTVHRLDLRNSGDTAGRKERVVGYGAWGFNDSNHSNGRLLTVLARKESVSGRL